MVSLSVIIPVYNDPQGVRDTLNSLVEQDFKEDYEALIVDNNSTDNTREVIKEFEEKYPDLIKGLEENEIQGSYAARNKGIKHAKGDIICFLDADMWVENDYLSRIHSYFEESSEIYYAAVNVTIVDNRSTWSSRYDVCTGFRMERSIKVNNFAPTCGLAVRSELFDAVGIFDEKLISSGDYEFGNRVNDSGYKMGFIKSAKAFHPARSSLRSLIKKYIRIGKGEGQLDKHYESISPNKHYLNPIKFLPSFPFNFRKRYLKNEKNISRKEVFMFFWIRYLLKLCRAYGRIKFHIAGK